MQGHFLKISEYHLKMIFDFSDSIGSFESNNEPSIASLNCFAVSLFAGKYLCFFSDLT